MMIDDDSLKQLLRINDELLQLWQVAERKSATWKPHLLYRSWTTSPTF
jgi:hypothetical protein